MKKFIFSISISLIFVQCSQYKTKRGFFKELKGYAVFVSSENDKLPLLGLDSLIVDSLSTSIKGKKYWYLSTPSNALFNINGYIRNSEKVVYIKPGDKSKGKDNKEQVLFDFSDDTTRSWVVQYERHKVAQNLVIIKEVLFYNKLIEDSTVIFRIFKEVKNTSFSTEFLIQVSLGKGLVSLKYLDRAKRKLYTIDYLPSAKVKYDTVDILPYQAQ